jgi:hypothetical protein
MSFKRSERPKHWDAKSSFVEMSTLRNKNPKSYLTLSLIQASIQLEVSVTNSNPFEP